MKNLAENWANLQLSFGLHKALFILKLLCYFILFYLTHTMYLLEKIAKETY